MRRANVIVTVVVAVLVVGTVSPSEAATLRLSWSDEHASADELVVSSDVVANCYVWLSVGGMDFNGYQFQMEMSEGLDVVIHQGTLAARLFQVASGSIINPGTPHVYLQYEDCFDVSGWVLVGQMTVTVDAGVVGQLDDEAVMWPVDPNYEPEYFENLDPANCRASIRIGHCSDWSGVTVRYDPTPVEAASWTDLKREFDD